MVRMTSRNVFAVHIHGCAGCFRELGNSPTIPPEQWGSARARAPPGDGSGEPGNGENGAKGAKGENPLRAAPLSYWGA